MNLDIIWTVFLSHFNSVKEIEESSVKKITGIPFLYIKMGKPLEKSVIEDHIRRFSAKAMKGKQLHSETIFVRKEEYLYVYRHRFYVPQQKMFCCGNLCDDCIRLTPNQFW
ncbi:hypothetical protein SAMN04488577_0826 [Bacillus sp. cl95]|nr:hypothetical protein SAMN02799634_101551 [Bacillus sp. UNCCL13]SFQ65898.1 hypothetical protein SAMN04488577_0826 [Bacillus sp. cl95]